MKKIKRRDFLKSSSATAAMTAALAHYPGAAFSQGISTKAPFNDYKALVCVFLHGGNDSYNMVIPRSNAEYNLYAQTRQNMAVLQTDLLPINPSSSDGTSYGLHPSMSGLQGLFESGRAAFVNNVGPLIEPTTKTAFLNQSVTLPPQLFSHADQQDQWYSLKGATVTKTGWAGRIADLMRIQVTNQQLATNVSLSGNSLFQAADDTVAYVMGNNGPIPFTSFATPEDLNDPSLTAEQKKLIELFIEQRSAFERNLNASYSTVYERVFANVQQRAVDTADLVNTALDGGPVLTTLFPDSPLGNQLRTVAEMIAVRDVMQMERQIFFVLLGGFDSHDDQVLNQPGLLGAVSEAMTAFYNATVEIGVANSVTSFTQSDFARTLTSNGDGTDHAWGGIQFVVGDAVQGRDMYGTYPDLALDGADDVGGGRLIPTTSADQYAVTLAKWFGIADIDLSMIAPNIDNFGIRDLGFLL